MSYYGRGLETRIRSEAVAGDWSRVEREERYPVSIESGVIVPVMSGMALGVAGVVVVVGVALGAEASLRGAVAWSFVIFGGVWFVSIALLLDASLSHLKSYELYDGASSSEETRQVLRLEVVNEENHQMVFGDLPIDAERFASFARSAETRGLAVSSWCGNGHLFTRPEFEAVVDYLTRAGLVRWVNEQVPQQGRELTPAGRATLRRYADSGDAALVLEG